MNMNDIIIEIYCMNDLADLLKITNAIRSRRDELSARIKNRFRVGQKVWFASNIDGKKIHGEVFKINRKNIRVKVDNYNIWTCPPEGLNIDTDLRILSND